jgi:uncharacterized membrane protein
MKSIKSILVLLGAFFMIIIGILVVTLKLIIIIPLIIIFFILSLFGFKFKSFIKTFSNFNVNKKKESKKKDYNLSEKTIDVEYKIKK